MKARAADPACRKCSIRPATSSRRGLGKGLRARHRRSLLRRLVRPFDRACLTRSGRGRTDRPSREGDLVEIDIPGDHPPSRMPRSPAARSQVARGDNAWKPVDNAPARSRTALRPTRRWRPVPPAARCASCYRGVTARIAEGQPRSGGSPTICEHQPRGRDQEIERSEGCVGSHVQDRRYCGEAGSRDKQQSGKHRLGSAQDHRPLRTRRTPAANAGGRAGPIPRRSPDAKYREHRIHVRLQGDGYRDCGNKADCNIDCLRGVGSDASAHKHRTNSPSVPGGVADQQHCCGCAI